MPPMAVLKAGQTRCGQGQVLVLPGSPKASGPSTQGQAQALPIPMPPSAPCYHGDGFHPYIYHLLFILSFAATTSLDQAA